jgi:hypothetical protein
MRNRKLIGFFAYVLLAVVLSACETRLKNGVVVDKWYEEGELETYVQYDVVFEMPMTKTRWDDEDFVLIVKGFNGKDTVKQRFEVSKTDYENTNVGDIVTFQ